MGGPEKIHDDLGADVQTDEVPTIESIVAHLQGLANPWVWKYIFLLDSSSHTLCVWSSLGLLSYLYKDFVFLVKGLFCEWVLVGTLVWIWDQPISLTLTSLWPIPMETVVVSLKWCQVFQPLAYSFGKAVFWRLAFQKSFQPGSSRTVVSLRVAGIAWKMFELSCLCCKWCKSFENCSLNEKPLGYGIAVM